MCEVDPVLHATCTCKKYNTGSNWVIPCLAKHWWVGGGDDGSVLFQPIHQLIQPETHLYFLYEMLFFGSKHPELKPKSLVVGVGCAM